MKDNAGSPSDRSLESVRRGRRLPAGIPKMRPVRVIAAVFVVGLTHGSVAAAEDWPRFLGPHANATSDETGLAREFPEAGPPVLWEREVGEGYGGVAVRDGEVYLHDRITGTADRLRVFDLESGDELWTSEYDAPGRLQFAGSRCVPTVEDELLYLQGGMGHLYCLDRQSHEVVWSVNLAEEYESSDPGYGWCQAPLVYEDLVIAAPLAEDVLLAAFDRFTGQEVWRTEGAGMSHSSPLLFELCGEPQVVFLSAQDDRGATFSPLGLPARTEPNGMPPRISDLSAFDPATGELRWRSGAYVSYYPITVPVQIDAEHLFVTSGYQSGSSLLEIRKDASGYTVEEVFHHARGSQIHVPLRVGNHVYLLANENDNDPRPRRKEGGLMCLDLDGNEVWRTGDDPYFGRGSMILADGMLIIQDGYNGTLRLVDPTPEGYRLLAEANIFQIEDRRDHQMWAPMALSRGRLLMRSQELLKCIQLRAEAP